MMEHEYIVLGEKGYEFHDDAEKRKKTKHEVFMINKLSNLPCKLLERPSTKFDMTMFGKRFIPRRNFMTTDYESDDAMLICAGYPHDEASDRIIAIYYKTDCYDLFGIKVGSILDDAIEVLESYGYQKVIEDGSEYWENSDVQVYIEGDIYVEKMRVEVKIFYMGNRVY